MYEKVIVNNDDEKAIGDRCNKCAYHKNWSCFEHGVKKIKCYDEDSYFYFKEIAKQEESDE